jgi:hypothetical protein
VDSLYFWDLRIWPHLIDSFLRILLFRRFLGEFFNLRISMKVIVDELFRGVFVGCCFWGVFGGCRF